jgi:3-methyl-2-oxobutanoate hydroxymethyltransferase
VNAKLEKNADSKPKKKIRAFDLINLKKNQKKITALTAYDHLTAYLLDQSGIDLILIGDSLANVFLGLDHTFQIGMSEMLYHTRAVSSAVKQALIVADMPFLSYQISVPEALVNAANLMKAGANAVKVEGASDLTIEIIRKCQEIGIPVIGHLGYTPQSAETIGLGRIQGRTELQAQKIINQALSLEKAGIFALVLEMIPADLAKQITETLKIPTIGIGAGFGCDGQVLVTPDLLGLTENNFKFTKKYANLASDIKSAVKNYISDIREHKFPTAENSF